jgi:F0F1-type ATP synthase membrane subunit b/b'
MDILHQLGELFLQAVPTVVIVFLFYFFLRWSFFGPIEKAMSERAARIEGARKEAAELEAAANQELDSYNEALRKATAQLYAEQEQARQAVLDERGRLLRAMRSRGQEEVEEAKKRIAAEIAAARPQVERQLPELANQIARAILERPSPLSGGAAR